MKKFNSFFLFLCVVVSLYGQGEYHTKLNAYTQLLMTEWEIQKNGATPAMATQSMEGETIEIENMLSLIDLENTIVQVEEDVYLKGFIKMTDSTCDDLLESYNVRIAFKADNIYSCDIPYDSIESLIKNEKVILVEASRPAVITMDEVRESSNINIVHAGMLPLNKEYKGKDVIVGLVDIGFDFTHPNFYDASGERYRIKKVWCQSDSKRTPDVSYGAVYSTEEEIKAKMTDSYVQTHGTHTAGIAAGGGYTTPYMGVAPESDLILVGTNLQTKAILDGIAFIINEAKKESKPCVINLSLGSKTGPKDGSTSEDMMMDYLSGTGAIIVGSAGNSGAENIHINKVFNGRGTDTLKTYPVPSYGSSSFTADIWERKEKPFYAKVELYNTGSKTIVAETDYIDVSKSSKIITLTTPTSNYSVYFMNTKYPSNNNYNCIVYIFCNGKAFSSSEYPVLKVYSDYSNEINIWGNNAVFSSRGVYGYTSGDNNSTMLSLGGVGKEIISVGAYTSKNKWYSLSGTPYVYGGTIYDIAPFSSRGPTADKRIKPDICAPGALVASGYNSFYSYGSTYPYTVATANFEGKDYYWGLDLGTSMSAPVVTGIIALWLENNPNLSAGDVRDILSNHSFDYAETRSLEKNNIFGWGKIDAFGGVSSFVSVHNEKISLQDSGLKLYVNQISGKLSLNSDKIIRSFTIYDTGGREIKNNSVTNNGYTYNNDTGENSYNYNIDIKDISKGIYIINIIGDNIKESSKFMIK